MSATPIKDLFDKEVLSKEDLEKRYKLVEKYGFAFMSIQSLIGKVLYSIHHESSLSAFSRLLNDYGLIVYDGETNKPVSNKELLDKLNHRKTECLIDADDLVFWKPSLNKERNYEVYIDDVARAYCLAGNNTFDWYNLLINPKCEMTSHPIPEEIKADIEQPSTANNQDDIKTDGETKLKPVIKNKDIKKPKRVNEWQQVIIDVINDYLNEYGVLPNNTQAWQRLLLNPPHGYDITKGTGEKKDCLKMPDSVYLTPKSFNERFKRIMENNFNTD